MKLATVDREKRTTAEERRAAKANRLKARQRFIRARKAEKQFQRNLLQVARQVGSIVSGMSIKGVVTSMPQLSVALARYSELIKPWAKAVSAKMVAEVDQRDENAWNEMGKEMGRNLRMEVKKAPTGERMRQLMDEQVDLITSLPIDAAKRVHKLTIEALNDGTRASEIAKEIERSGEVTASRARLIARTETSRTITAMTQARAEFIGSTQFVWETSRDSDVRHIHQELQGKVFDWDNPPVAGENGERALPGAIYNCRCWANPIIPDKV